MNSMQNAVSTKLLDDAHQLHGLESVVLRRNTWKAEELLGELIIDGVPTERPSEASEAVSALQTLIGFASKKLPARG